MSQEQQLKDEAADHATATSWTWDKFLAEIRKNPAYNYKNTQWYEAGACLEELKHLDPVPETELASAQGRVFLANSPLDSLQGPNWLVPVVTADPAYTECRDPGVIAELRDWFGTVECWCDSREDGTGTSYQTALQMVDDLRLDGPPWGQCESAKEFDWAYNAGARRMVGNLSALRQDQRDRIASAEVLITAELYRNCQPWMQPDWMNANAGIGGNCIACYADAECYYTSVASYKNEGLYVSKSDSIYGVGLRPEDWLAL